MAEQDTTNEARHDVLRELRRLRARRGVDARDELRLLRVLAAQTSQTELARALRISQPAVSGRLQKAAEVPEVREGFSGADPYEIAERYAAGLLTRERLVDELTRWDYRPHRPANEVDWMSGDSGEWNETVVPALDDRLLEDDVYDEVQRRRAARHRSEST